MKKVISARDEERDKKACQRKEEKLMKVIWSWESWLDDEKERRGGEDGKVLVQR